MIPSINDSKDNDYCTGGPGSNRIAPAYLTPRADKVSQNGSLQAM